MSTDVLDPNGKLLGVRRASTNGPVLELRGSLKSWLKDKTEYI